MTPRPTQATPPPTKPGSSATTVTPTAPAPKEEEKKEGTYVEVYDANGKPSAPTSGDRGAQKKPDQVDPNSPKKVKPAPAPKPR
jgi:hypothetical protein